MYYYYYYVEKLAPELPNQHTDCDSLSNHQLSITHQPSPGLIFRGDQLLRGRAVLGLFPLTQYLFQCSHRFPILWGGIEVGIIKVDPLSVSFDEFVFSPMHGKMKRLQ